MVENDGALLTAELLKVARLHIAENLETHGFKVVKKTGQLQTGTAHIIHCNGNPFKILCFVQLN